MSESVAVMENEKKSIRDEHSEPVSVTVATTTPQQLDMNSSSINAVSPAAAEKASFKKDSCVEKPAPAAVVTPVASSKQQATSSTRPGLSELSKQLRVLQAKNESQSVEMDRLERQLRILSDLEGISLKDLRRALEEACESEAHGELQHKVASLRAQLEAASVARQAVHLESAAQHQLATLQLRIGELEEVDEKQRQEIRGLYEQLGEQKTLATRLQGELQDETTRTFRLKAELEKQKVEGLQLRQQLADSEKSLAAGTQRNLVVSKKPSAPLDDKHRQVVVSEKQIAPLKDTQKQLVASETNTASADAANLEAMTVALRHAHIEMQILKDKMALSEQQRQAAEQQARLREAQFKARCLVQEERMKDLNQQTSSLYTAFEMVQQEHTAVEETRESLKISLHEADAEVARQVHDLDRSSRSLGTRSPNQSSRSLVPHSPSSPDQQYDQSSGSLHMVPDSPPYAEDSSSHSQIVPIAPSVSIGVGEPIIAGVLLLRTGGMLRKWKKHHVVLYSTLANHVLDLGNGKCHTLQFAVSKVELYPKQAFAFALDIDPQNPQAPILYAAARSAKDFDKWMSALTEATTGSEYVGEEILST